MECMEDAYVNVFFTRKEAQSELIAGWKDTTKRKLHNIYMNFMTDANLLTVIEKKKTIDVLYYNQSTQIRNAG